jgi:hypothetical protein
MGIGNADSMPGPSGSFWRRPEPALKPQRVLPLSRQGSSADFCGEAAGSDRIDFMADSAEISVDMDSLRGRARSHFTAQKALGSH